MSWRTKVKTILQVLGILPVFWRLELDIMNDVLYEFFNLMNHSCKVVLVGCGGMSGQWLSQCQEIDDVDVVGLVDLSLEAAEKQKEHFELKDAQVGTDLAEMLKLTQPDVLMDVTIPKAHYSVAMTAFEHGCHLLSEKPMAESMEQAREMLQASKDANKLYVVMQNRRFTTPIQKFKKSLESGMIGDLTTVNADFYIGAHFSQGDKTDFRDQMEHVLLLDMAIHSFDQARYISGADPVRVYCHEFNPKGSWYAHGASAQAVFEMSNGMVFNYRGSWCSEGLNTSWECDWRVVGSCGSAKWDGGEQMQFSKVAENSEGGFMHAQAEPEALDIDALEHEGHGGVIRDFLKALNSEHRPLTLAEDNIKSLAMVHGAIESAQRGQAVDISLS